MICDTNIIISILIEPTESKKSFVAENVLSAPEFLQIELINVLRKFHFLQGISKADVMSYYFDGIKMVDAYYQNSALLNGAIKLSFDLNHPIYDCLFLALAINKDEPFLSLDKRLLEKAKVLGISTIDEI